MQGSSNWNSQALYYSHNHVPNRDLSRVHRPLPTPPVDRDTLNSRHTTCHVTHHDSSRSIRSLLTPLAIQVQFINRGDQTRRPLSTLPDSSSTQALPSFQDCVDINPSTVPQMTVNSSTKRIVNLLYKLVHVIDWD
jgi:hypothetical protein